MPPSMKSSLSPPLPLCRERKGERGRGREREIERERGRGLGLGLGGWVGVGLVGGGRELERDPAHGAVNKILLSLSWEGRRGGGEKGRRRAGGWEERRGWARRGIFIDTEGGLNVGWCKWLWFRERLGFRV